MPCKVFSVTTHLPCQTRNKDLSNEKHSGVVRASVHVRVCVCRANYKRALPIYTHIVRVLFVQISKFPRAPANKRGELQALSGTTLEVIIILIIRSGKLSYTKHIYMHEMATAWIRSVVASRRIAYCVVVDIYSAHILPYRRRRRRLGSRKT